MRRKITSAVIATVLTAALATQISAEPSAEDAYKYRESIMTSLKGHVGAISMMTRGLAGNPRHLSSHAEAIANLSAELSSIFPEGSNVEHSEALPIIWEEPEKFAEAVARAEKAMAAIAVAASDNNVEAVGRAFRNLGEACKGCHDRYRKEHDH